MPKGHYIERPPGTKFCPRCQTLKSLEDFPLATKSRDGRFTYCKPCLKEKNALRTQEQRHGWHISQRYGLNGPEYQAMLKAQKGRCAICRHPPRGKSTRGTAKPLLAVDHCHKSGAVRQLLCTSCNQALGLMEDSVVRLRAAIRYLKKHG